MTGKPTPKKGEPEPFEVGQKLNLRRQMPDGPKAHLDQGWEVVGYTWRDGERWLGYELRNAQGETTSMSKYEAVDAEGGECQA